MTSPLSASYYHFLTQNTSHTRLTPHQPTANIHMNLWFLLSKTIFLFVNTFLSVYFHNDWIDQLLLISDVDLADYYGA